MIRRLFSDSVHIKKAKTIDDLFSLNPAKLNLKEINDWTYALKLAGWSLGEDSKRQFMTKTYEFKNFREAWLFMEMSALAADRIDHHPEWSNVYNRVQVLLSTHTVQSLTVKDIVMAYSMVSSAQQESVRGADRQGRGRVRGRGVQT